MCALAGTGEWSLDAATGQAVLDRRMLQLLRLPGERWNLPWDAFIGMVSRESRDRFRAIIDEATATGEDFVTETWFETAGGPLRLLQRGKPVAGGTGGISGITCAVTDLTGCLSAGHGPACAEDALRQVFASGPDAFFLCDSGGTIIDVNPRMLEMYGATKEEVQGLELGALFSGAKDGSSPLSAAWEAVRSVGTARFECRTGRPSHGRQFDVEVTLSKARLPAADLMIVVVREISERKKLQDTLLLTAKVFEHTVEGVVVTDGNGVIEMVNPAFSRITGYGAEEAVGKTPSILKSAHHEEEFYREMWRQLLNQGNWSGEIWNRRKSGELYPEWLNVNAIMEEGRPRHFVGIFHDITELKKSEEAMRYRAYHDPLTGLPNRVLFMDRLTVALSLAQRQGRKVAVLFLDLDHFKTVNDTFGHSTGDALLQEVAARLLHVLRDEDTVSRLGGDEFTVIIPDAVQPRDVAAAAGRIMEALSRPYLVQAQRLNIGVSIGISLFPDDGSHPEELVDRADTAMYRAKQKGRGNFQFFSAGQL